jgi:AcrR family transcriptional regulator
MPGATPPENLAYHHGNLRDALIVAALELEPEYGPLGISLREVARRVGVTHAAAYHHFENKDALVLAVADQGFRTLIEGLDRDIAAARDPFFAVIDAAVSYTRFAVRGPSQFRFMYGTSPASADPLEAWHAELLQRFERVVKSAQEGKLMGPGPAERPAAQLWSVAHGFASLTLAGALDGAPRARKDKRSPKQTERRALDLVRATTVGLLLGMAPPDSPWRSRLSGDS